MTPGTSEEEPDHIAISQPCWEKDTWEEEGDFHMHYYSGVLILAIPVTFQVMDSNTLIWLHRSIF